MRRAFVSVALVALFLAAAGKQDAASGKPDVSYVRDVQPFMTKYCLECHNHSKAKSGYNVETFAALMKGGKKGPMVVPEKPAESRLIVTLHGKGKPMPPKKSPQPTAEETAKMAQWIEAGARDDSNGEDGRKVRGGATD
jgi:mono/diheme cytochrome c family protein